MADKANIVQTSSKHSGQEQTTGCGFVESPLMECSYRLGRDGDLSTFPTVRDRWSATLVQGVGVVVEMISYCLDVVSVLDGEGSCHVNISTILQ